MSVILFVCLWSYLCVCDLICVSVILFACLWSYLRVCDLICMSVILFVCLWSYLYVSLCRIQTHRSALAVTLCTFVDSREVYNSAEPTVAADIRWIECDLNFFVFVPLTATGSPKYLITLTFSKNLLAVPTPPVRCLSLSSYMSYPSHPNVTRKNFSRR